MSRDHTITTPLLTLTVVRLLRGQYDDGTTALLAVVPGGEVEVLSISLAAYGRRAPEDHVFVKDYSEHAGLPEALERAALAESVDRLTCGPFQSQVVLMRLTDNAR